MTIIRSLLLGLMMLAIGACTTNNDGRVPLGPIGQRVADAVIDVSNENRGLRICWLAAGAVEVMTDLAQRGGDIRESLGHLVLLQGAIDKAHGIDPLWIETDTADVALLFATVLKDVGKSRLSQILIGGPTLSNFLNVAKRTVILTVKGGAVMRDINRVLQGVEDGTLPAADAWEACEARTEMNRDTLYLMSGVSNLSSTSFMEKTTFTGGTDFLAGVALNVHGGGTGPFLGGHGNLDGGTSPVIAGVAPVIDGWDTVSDWDMSPSYQPIFGPLEIAGGESVDKSWYTGEFVELDLITSGTQTVGIKPGTDKSLWPFADVELDFIQVEGWRDEKQMMFASGGDWDISGDAIGLGGGSGGITFGLGDPGSEGITSGVERVIILDDGNPGFISTETMLAEAGGWGLWIKPIGDVNGGSVLSLASTETFLSWKDVLIAGSGPMGGDGGSASIMITTAEAGRPIV